LLPVGGGRHTDLALEDEAEALWGSQSRYIAREL
jgi:hypothetical protein